VRINEVPSDHFAKEYFAPRPASERLLTTKLDMRGLNVMRDWRTCLSEYVADRYAGYLDPA
jgi:dTDP-4-dehydrorhamnose reductase